MNTKFEQENTYQVLYSDGVKVIDYIVAPNLIEAKKIAAMRSKNYSTAYYKVSRCYNGGVRGSSQNTFWH